MERLHTPGVLAAASLALLLCGCPGGAGGTQQKQSGRTTPGATDQVSAQQDMHKLPSAEQIEAMAPAEAFDELQRLDGGVDCERLIEHCFAGEAAQVRLYLRSGGSPDCVQSTPERSSPLVAASVAGRAEIVRLLLAAGCQIDTSDPDSESTALAYAAREGHLEVVRLLLDAGADPRHSDKASVTPLHAAAAQGRLDVVKELLARGVPVDLLSEKKDENLGGITPLIYAALGGHSEVAQYLVDEAGADPKHIAGNGSSAAMAALHLKNLDLAKYLYSKGSQPLCFYNNNMSTLALAAQIGYIEGIDWLVQEVGVDVDTRNKRDGATALIVSVANGYRDCTRRLLELGADPHIAGADGKNAFDIARENKMDEVLQILNGDTKAASGSSKAGPGDS